RFIYSDAYWSETVAYADLVLPDTTYLERWDCISLLDRPISSAHGPGDAIRQPVVEPDRDVRPFQTVLLDLGARLGLPGMWNHDEGRPTYPGGYADYIVNHERTPGVGPLAGWRGDGGAYGKGPVNPDQLNRYIENGAFWSHDLPADQRYLRHANGAYLNWAQSMGFVPSTDQIVLQLYSETLQKFRLAARGHGVMQPPPEHKERIETYFDPLPIWYMPFEEEAVDGEEYPLHAITQRPMHMYHSWGSQNAWLRQITTANRLYMHPETAADLDIEDDDWIWLTSPHGRVKGQVKLMTGTNKSTVWTWNAIGKRKGAWGLDNAAPEATKGFLLNHLISELLPAKEGGYRYANSDPVTGQAAWYDLRVNVDKCAADEVGETAPIAQPQKPAPLAKKRPSILRYGKTLTGQPSGEPPVSQKDWIGNRHEVAETVEGVPDGHGNKTESDR
ncbi:MAG: molybdopterin oxidoreductase family protein, partial [Pseudomonadota bacterium]